MSPSFLAFMELGLKDVLLLAAAIFCVGVYGVLSRQNILVILMCLELIFNSANLALVALGRSLLYKPFEAETDLARIANIPDAFVVMVLAVVAAKAAVGLAILLAVYRKWRTTNSGEIHELSG